MKINRKLLHLTLLLGVMFLTTHQVVSQSGLNPLNTVCGESLIQEDFGAMQPIGWTGSFNMGVVVTEGWTSATGPTPTANTGPDAPFKGSHYLYLETNGPAPLDSSYRIQTPVIDFGGDASILRFRLLMHGAQIGSFQVNVLTGPTYTTRTQLLNRVGQQHTSGAVANWEDIFLDLTAYSSQMVKIEFVGMKGAGELGDIGIDDVVVCKYILIPTLSQWGIIILSLLALIIGILGIRNNERNRGRLIPIRVRSKE